MQSMNDRVHDNDRCSILSNLHLVCLNLLTATSHGGVNDPLQRSRLKMQFAFCLGVRYASHLSPIVTNGVSRLQTNKYNSPCWPSCHGHALPPSWLKACNPARNGGAHDHSGVYHGVVL